MRGMIKKELVSLLTFPAWLCMLIIMIVPIAVSVNTDREVGVTEAFMFAAMYSQFVVMIVMTSTISDEKTGWNKFVLTTPVTRKQFIGSKYIVSVISNAAFALLGAVCPLVIMLRDNCFDIKTYFFFIAVLLFLCALIHSIVFPIMLRFGQTAGLAAYLILFITMLFGGVIFFVSFGNNETAAGFVADVLHADKLLLSAVLLGAFAVLTTVSLFVSFALYKRKQF